MPLRNPNESKTYHNCWRPSRDANPVAGAGAHAMIFETLDTFGHEQVVFCHNKDAGLKAIIAIHNTVLGPALGGNRMWTYKSEEEASTRSEERRGGKECGRKGTPPRPP